MRIRTWCAAVTGVLFSLTPVFGDNHAADSGFYFGLGAAMNFADATTETAQVRWEDDFGAGGSQFDQFYWFFEPGFTLGGAAGYAFENVRVEGEFSYSTSILGHWDWEARDAGGNVTNRTFIERRLDAFGMMANAVNRQG